VTQLGFPPLLGPSWPYLPAWWLGALHLWRGNPLHPCSHPPCLLVVHCGDKRAALAEYMVDPTDREGAPSAVLCHDGLWRRQVATHAAWHAGLGRLVQCLPLTLEGWGTGSATWANPDTGMALPAQRIAWHVELPGPPDQERGQDQLTDLQAFAVELATRGCTHWVRHSLIDQRKEDPGPGLPDDWADGTGLRRG
jgi:hypothetical protein